MRISIFRKMAWTLAIVSAIGFCRITEGQEPAPASSPNDTSYSTASEVAPLPNAQTTAGSVDATLVANSSQTNDDLAAQLADLKATVKKLEDKAAEDKKKADGKPTVKVGGRLQYDVAAFSQNAASISSAGDMKNGTQIRRAYIGLSGDFLQNIDYKVEMNFAGQSSNEGTSANPIYDQQTQFKDVYLTVKQLPMAGNVRVGNFYECFGLETQTSDNYVTFMERNITSAAGKIGDRKPGVMLFNWNEQETATWAVGAFAWQAGTPPTFPLNTAYDDAGGTAFDTRATWLPWYDEESGGRGYMHFGCSYSYRDVAQLVTGSTATRYSISVNPESNLANAVANTGNISDADHMNVFSPEFIFNYGSFSVQSEYEWIELQRDNHDDPTFDGGYVQVSYFLTGEYRPYLRKEGLTGRVVPLENFFRVRNGDGISTGIGAWELAYRVSYMNLTNSGITGGRTTDNTFGLNWYLNPFTKVMFNYVHSETTDRGSYDRAIVDLVEARAAINF